MLTTITPKYVNADSHTKEGKPRKYGSIVDQSDVKYMVQMAMTGQFQRGVPINIDYEHEDWGNGPLNVVQRVSYDSGPQQELPPLTQPVPYTPPSHIAQPEHSVVGTPSNPRPLPEDPTAENIFVTGIVGRAAGAGAVMPETISLWTKAAIAAWRDRH